MTPNAPYPTKVLLGLIILSTCVSLVIASSSNRERRHVAVEESSHRPGRTATPGSRSFKSSTSKNNEITAEPGRKVSHRLIGGHLRADTKNERNESLWDDGILMSSAGNGKEGKNNRGDEDDDKKSLSQQVKEGKYGLIQDEIYEKHAKRPGIISYLGNPEVPKDTIDNLGGLEEDEIWLAENHVLVLRGGKFPGHEAGQSSTESPQTWPPIDNYKAPRRQVKIPPRPKVPPPFPVQLSEGGPVQIIGPNGTTEIGNDTLDYENDPIYGKGLLPGDGPFFAFGPNGTILTLDRQDPKNVTIEEKSLIRDRERTKPETLPPNGLPPFYHAIPPGAVFLPPPSNQSDYDEEDQSIYYPPPYSFHYPRDNTTAVPPGPLVPGIILPPPPDFFSALDERKSTTKKYTKRPTTTPLPRQRPTYLPPRKLTTKQQKSSTAVPTVQTPTTVIRPVSTKVYGRTRYKNSTRTSPRSSLKTVPYVQVTTPTPIVSTTIDTTETYNTGTVNRNQVSETTREKTQSWPQLVTSKTLPIVAYYPTTPSTIEKPIEVTPATVKNIVTTSSPGRSSNQASYYFYEEPNEDTTSTSANPTTVFYRTTTETPLFKIESPARTEEKKTQYYSVETVPSQETAKDYDVKFIDSVIKNSQPFGYGEAGVTQAPLKYEKSPPRAQGQRMLPDRAPVYYQSIPARQPAAVQSYYTTPKPQTYYRQDTKPKPIYQYSFEAADYSKHGNQRQQYKQQQQQQSVSYNDYRDIKVGRQQYDYDDIETLPEKRLENVSFKPRAQIYPSTTVHSTINTTPNPQQVFFTQQDERLLDDVTKEYFTMFGKKLSNQGIPSTTPIYGKSSVTERPDYNVNAYIQNNYNTAEAPVYKTPNVKVRYGDEPLRPYSLKDDTLVNYRKPLPPINPDSEFITVVDPKPRQQPFERYRVQTANYRLQSQEHQALTQIHGYASQQIVQPGNNPSTNYVPIVETAEELDEAYPQRPLSLQDDIDVNYRDPRPAINPDAEFIDPITVQDTRTDKPKAYFAYRLPGDGGHFYFLTPQAITQRPEQNTGYVYPKSRGTRLLRRRRRPGNV